MCGGDLYTPEFASILEKRIKSVVLVQRVSLWQHQGLFGILWGHFSILVIIEWGVCYRDLVGEAWGSQTSYNVWALLWDKELPMSTWISLFHQHSWVVKKKTQNTKNVINIWAWNSNLHINAKSSFSFFFHFHSHRIFLECNCHVNWEKTVLCFVWNFTQKLLTILEKGGHYSHAACPWRLSSQHTHLRHSALGLFTCNYAPELFWVPFQLPDNQKK